MDGAISKLHYAAFQLVPYHTCSRTSIPVTRLIKRKDLVKIYLDKDLAEEIVEGDGGPGVEMEDSEAVQEVQGQVLRSGRRYGEGQAGRR